MCGIAGVVARGGGLTSAVLKSGVDRLAHRGPEAEGFWCNPGGTVALGHRRLCIIDLSPAAAQPMHHAGRYTLVYNGEIYNYRELRKELEVEGEVLRTQSDTEVLLAAYRVWGKDCLQRFDGMFAFALWDEEEQELFAARDRLGEKPIYYSATDGRLVFASELKALWPMGVEKRVNEGMLYNFLTLGYTTNPTDARETFYVGVERLPAAHWMKYSFANDSLETGCYWQVYLGEEKSISETEAIETFNTLFADSIRKRLRSDVAIGTSLSGGLDSSAIVAFCADEEVAQYTHQCFTASFPGFEKDETARAAMVARQYGLQHVVTTVSAADVPDLMDRIAAQQDEPFSSSSALAQYAVFAAAKAQGVTVLLDGQGADELLAGYHQFYRWRWAELYRQRKLESSGERKAAQRLGVQQPFGPSNKLAALLPDFTGALRSVQKRKQAARLPSLDRGFAQRNQAHFAYTLPVRPTLNGALHHQTFVNGLEEILRLADRNSMAHSVEVRLPFLQHRLVEFLFSLPPQFKIQQGWTKWLLRQALHTKLPREIVWQAAKVGYEPPQKIWMEEGNVQERIRWARQTLAGRGVLNAGAVNKPIQPKAAHEEGSLDWRYWSAAHLFH